MFDHIYQQQEIFNYYAWEISKNNQSTIKIRNPELPFAEVLVNINKFSCPQRKLLFIESMKSLDHISYEDLKDSNDCDELSIIILVLGAICLTVKHYCQSAAQLISSINTENSQLILNEYLKRYKSFIDFAICFHQTYQNLSIIVNILMDTCKSNHLCGGFSIINMLVSG